MEIRVLSRGIKTSGAPHESFFSDFLAWTGGQVAQMSCVGGVEIPPNSQILTRVFSEFRLYGIPYVFLNAVYSV